VASSIQFCDQLVEETAALPGATGACAISEMPLDTPGGWYTFVPEVRTDDLKIPQASTIGVTAGCLDVLGIPILHGRRFESSETENVAIVSTSTAEALWPGEADVLDRIVRLGTASGMPLRVVGVAPDIRLGSLETIERGQVWLPSSRGFPTPERLIVATEVPPATLAGPVRDVLTRLAPGLALANVRTMDDVVASATAARRFVLVLLGAFAAIALVLCGVGIYGVLSHHVGQRTREIGIRVALGARRLDVTRTIGRQLLAGVVVGIAAGMAASWAMSSMLATQMFEMSATDTRVYAGVAVFVSVMATIAALPPLGRALRVPPVTALRTGSGLA
jgi:ABC-type antimicrobial peptide transport system permease subunit